MPGLDRGFKDHMIRGMQVLLQPSFQIGVLHTHGKLKGIGKSFDVGVDCIDFVPLSLDKVAEKMTHLT